MRSTCQITISGRASFGNRIRALPGSRCRSVKRAQQFRELWRFDESHVEVPLELGTYNEPSPTMTPEAMSERNEWCLKGSRAWTLEICAWEDTDRSKFLKAPPPLLRPVFHSHELLRKVS